MDERKIFVEFFQRYVDIENENGQAHKFYLRVTHNGQYIQKIYVRNTTTVKLPESINHQVFPNQPDGVLYGKLYFVSLQDIKTAVSSLKKEIEFIKFNNNSERMTLVLLVTEMETMLKSLSGGYDLSFITIITYYELNSVSMPKVILDNLQKHIDTNLETK